MSMRRHLGALLGAVLFNHARGADFGRAVMDNLFSHAPQPSFGQRYGSNPKSHNGGRQSGAAAAKRAARKHRNIAKHPRSAA